MEIELSESILIQCPEKGFEMRKAVKCFICPHYKGIIRITVDSKPIKGNEADDFQVSCGRPITRRLIKIMDD